MSIVTQTSRSRTSAQIALEDRIFQELFGMDWNNGGYILRSKQDLSWAIFYKDLFLQGLSDYANEGFLKFYSKDKSVIANKISFAHESAKEWVENDSPFNDNNTIQELKERITEAIKEFHIIKPKYIDLVVFNRKLDKAREILVEQEDPFSFDKCCEVLGLKVDVTRARFKLYRNLKLKYKDKIRIVTYTGLTKNVNIPSFEDIIEAEEANGEHDLTLFLHIGVKRRLRNNALVRSKNERTD